MPKPIAYIETTIPSFHYSARADAAATRRRAWTREWWVSARETHDLVTSQEVLLELAAGTSELVPLRLELLKAIPLLPLVPQLAEIVATYARHKLMPARSGGDAVHLAIASLFECDFIVTWNCKHLANPNKFEHIRRVNRLLGLPVPDIVTPLDLLLRPR